MKRLLLKFFSSPSMAKSLFPTAAVLAKGVLNLFVSKMVTQETLLSFLAKAQVEHFSFFLEAFRHRKNVAAFLLLQTVPQLHLSCSLTGVIFIFATVQAKGRRYITTVHLHSCESCQPFFSKI